MKVPEFNLTAFIIATLTFMLLTLMSFTATFTIDEGVVDPSFFVAILAKIFPVFQFPIYTIFNYSDGRFFFFGLGINSLFYGFLTERIIGFFKSRFK